MKLQFTVILLAVFLALVNCSGTEFNKVSKSNFDLIESLKGFTKNVVQSDSKNNTRVTPSSLETVLSGVDASVNVDQSFQDVIRSAVASDPSILSARDELVAKRLDIEILNAQKEFVVTGTAYGGIEDITDKTTGIALVLNAQRMLFDGGMVDAQIERQSQLAMSARYSLIAQMDRKVLNFASIWIDLERYSELSTALESRLEVLDPLISQLDKVAKAGIGDVTKVAAAQRTVSAIRVEQADVRERLAQSRSEFINAFGALPKSYRYDDAYITAMLPVKISDDLKNGSPALLAEYASYLSAEAGMASIKAKKILTLVWRPERQGNAGE